MGFVADCSSGHSAYHAGHRHRTVNARGWFRTPAMFADSTKSRGGNMAESLVRPEPNAGAGTCIDDIDRVGSAQRPASHDARHPEAFRRRPCAEGRGLRPEGRRGACPAGRERRREKHPDGRALGSRGAGCRRDDAGRRARALREPARRPCGRRRHDPAGTRSRPRPRHRVEPVPRQRTHPRRRHAAPSDESGSPGPARTRRAFRSMPGSRSRTCGWASGSSSPSPKPWRPRPAS